LDRHPLREGVYVDSGNDFCGMPMSIWMGYLLALPACGMILAKD
jgi:hypothetical protein